MTSPQRQAKTGSTIIDLNQYIAGVRSVDLLPWTGEVVELVGMLIASRGPAVAVGDFCEVVTAGGRRIRTQVVGFRDGHVLSMPLEEIDGIQLHDRIIARREDAQVAVGPDLAGRVLDGFGKPLDRGRPIRPDALYRLYQAPGSPLDREHIVNPIATGIRAIDTLIPVGTGQRMGIFGGSGVGKSTLLGAMARHNSADITVIALIGERNREVRAFLEHELGPEGRSRSVVVCSTSDRPAPLRVRACFVALAIAEYFRDQGANVLLIMDSVTRLAMAQREIGLAAGEPPSQKGYTPSVFNLLPRILERAGNFQKGSITGFFTVLVEGDDFNEPVCDAVRSILDGHIILSRRMAAAGHYPAIDVMNSVSRLGPQLSSPEHMEAARKIRGAMATYEGSKDLIELGAYSPGTNPALDAAVRMQPEITAFLKQDTQVDAPFAASLERLKAIAERL
jgi:flagellum-specific ATP synthase